MGAPFALWQLSDSGRVYSVAADDIGARHVSDPKGLEFAQDLLRLGGHDASIHRIDVTDPAHESRERWLRDLLADAGVPTA